MNLLSDLLKKLTEALSKDIILFYTNFHAYTLDLLRHKNVNLENMILQSDDDLTILIDSINSALNTTGIPITELSNGEVLRTSFQGALRKGSFHYKDLFNTIGKEFINRHLFKIIFEYVIDFDKIKIENLDLFDLLPPYFKKELDQFKKRISLSKSEKQKLKSLINTIDAEFNASTLKFKHQQLKEANEEIDILSKLQEAKKSNIEALESPKVNQSRIKKEDFYVEKSLETAKYYFDYFGNFPIITSKMVEKISINSISLKEISSNMDLFVDLEILFYYISILKILNIKNPFSPQKIAAILKNFIKNKVFSSGMYHIPNPIANFHGLSILLEYDMISGGENDLIDLLDIEMFLESEIKPYLPSKLYLNYYTFLAFELLAKSGISIMNKFELLETQLSLDLYSIPPKDIPNDLLSHVTLIKLIDRNYNFDGKYSDIDYKQLIPSSGLVNNNITDTARLILILDVLDLYNQEEKFIKSLLNAILTSYQGFSVELPQYNWKTHPLALKTELRMLFWLLLVFLRF